MKRAAFLLIVVSLAAVALKSQTPSVSRDHPAIAYSSNNLNDPVTGLTRKIQRGEVQLAFDRESGYLRSLLDALNLPIESQVAVFSKTSFQSRLIGPQNPRAIFFNDSIAMAWTRGGFIELASVDPRQGVIFYTFGQFARSGQSSFVRDQGCLVCHVSQATSGVPGLAIGSVFPAQDGTPVADGSNLITDHRSPTEQRWGGWYVTGVLGSLRHLGNRIVNPNNPTTMAPAPTPSFQSLKGQFDLTGYPSPYSDVVALMILEHQTHLTNLITRIGWESRINAYDRTKAGNTGLAREFVDYLLFVDEARLPTPIKGTSGFAERFQQLGPNDSKGRSLRQLDLKQDLMRYPCSYMIYSPAFDGMPADAKASVYNRLWDVLSGRDANPRYSRLSLADRKAVTEILRETKKDLPSYFGQVSR
jgi:hypothetical protein